MSRNIPKLTSLKTETKFRARLDELGIQLPLSSTAPVDILSRPLSLRDGVAGNRQVGNRFAILPMEGWDATVDGRPTELVRRRWRRFGESGAKLIWCEATAVRSDGRANANQLLLDSGGTGPLGDLRRELVEAHQARFGRTDDLVVGLQLTHSGRWARPDGTPHPRTAFVHPWLDRRVNADETSVFSDDELSELTKDYVAATVRARDAGFDFVDVKHCHGYLLHELLATQGREGEYGGTMSGRTRFLREVVSGIRKAAPELHIAVRLSAFDFAPFRMGEDGT